MGPGPQMDSSSKKTDGSPPEEPYFENPSEEGKKM